MCPEANARPLLDCYLDKSVELDPTLDNWRTGCVVNKVGHDASGIDWNWDEYSAFTRIVSIFTFQIVILLAVCRSEVEAAADHQ